MSCRLAQEPTSCPRRAPVSSAGLPRTSRVSGFELLPGRATRARHVGVARACQRISADLFSLLCSLIPQELFFKPSVFEFVCSSRSCGFGSQKVAFLIPLPRSPFPPSSLTIPAWLPASSWPERCCELLQVSQSKPSSAGFSLLAFFFILCAAFFVQHVMINAAETSFEGSELWTWSIFPSGSRAVPLVARRY